MTPTQVDAPLAHRFEGDCPEDSRPADRDPLCHACRVLDLANTAGSDALQSLRARLTDDDALVSHGEIAQVVDLAEISLLRLAAIAVRLDDLQQQLPEQRTEVAHGALEAITAIRAVLQGKTA